MCVLLFRTAGELYSESHLRTIFNVDIADDGLLLDDRSPHRCCTSCGHFQQCTNQARRQSLGSRAPDDDDAMAPEANSSMAELSTV